MAKILISPLGAGTLDRNNQAAREYRTATYRLGEENYKNKSFVAAVLFEHFNIDDIIFIGTVRSMWEEVYRVFSKERSHEIDEDYYYNLVEKIEKLTYADSLDNLDLKPIEDILGNRSKCMLIKYGLNEEEIQQNLEIILSIVEYFQEGDEIYIDITHSFRSLSIFLFLILMFISDLVEEKKIIVKGVYYGMLDIITELNYAPIVNLQTLFELTQWIKGAHSLKEFGNGYLISQLLRNDGEEDLAKNIENLSDIININYLPDIRQSNIKLNQSLDKYQGKSPFKYLKTILENFSRQFLPLRERERECDFQLRLAKWYFDNKRYATGYITLAEAIITYLCEINDKNPKSKSHRDEMKDMVHAPEYKEYALSKLFIEINPIRKNIAHALIDEKKTAYTSAIENAHNFCQRAKTIFRTGQWG